MKPSPFDSILLLLVASNWDHRFAFFFFEKKRNISEISITVSEVVNILFMVQMLMNFSTCLVLIDHRSSSAAAQEQVGHLFSLEKKQIWCIDKQTQVKFIPEGLSNLNNRRLRGSERSKTFRSRATKKSTHKAPQKLYWNSGKNRGFWFKGI